MDPEKLMAAERTCEMVFGPGGWSRVVAAVQELAEQASLDVEILDVTLRGGRFRVQTASRPRASTTAERLIAWWPIRPSKKGSGIEVDGAR